MKFSIIIPTYNNPEQLKRCLESISSQSFSDYELIVIEDINHAGLSFVRNEGIQKAQGDYLMFIDSDDTLENGTLKELADATLKYPDADIIEFSIIVHEGANDEHRLTFDEIVYTNLVDDYWLGNEAYSHTYACNKVYRKSIFERVTFPVGKLFEDAFTLPFLLNEAKMVVTIPNGLYHYLWNKDGICANASGRDLQDLLEAHIRTIKMWDLEHHHGFSRYFMHLINIQIDVFRDTQQILLPEYSVHLHRMKYSIFIKLLIYKIFGLKILCKIFR